ncbi:HEAT domain containing protein [Thermobaculum terrenum ATCC BAA-798]|uniref:HEAT domain containing protein n=1 Tax=Thermobaculum terrenum (strain ATCC BAA-798 / CCMEE 7001 / YNP1) TaxID=525904 RepID=D1CHC6_THET1|nr:HEAT repeat domain-containing protein [Thermobaculum terrenum]ACZ43147.1 HEAT domain containing protein [Thermobaculum terrenum ATCC BAA-798]
MDIWETMKKLAEVQRGFRPIEEEADRLVKGGCQEENLSTARMLLRSDLHQTRMFATLVLGYIASTCPDALHTLRYEVSLDPDWRVQEMLAKAFAKYCRDVGYESALPVIEDWLGDQNPNVRRAAVEGLRPWIRSSRLPQQPQRAVRLLAPLRADDSQQVRRSVGNALRDLSRRFPDIVRSELATWDLTDGRVLHTYTLASRLLEAPSTAH